MLRARLAYARKIEIEQDGLYCARYFFKHRFGIRMNIARFHFEMQRALDRTMLPPWHTDFIPRLIINIPPGYSKTEICVINYIVRGLAINSMARFLHLSYSKFLVLLNSSTARQIVKSSSYQSMWPIGIKPDTDSKHIWHTDAGGGVTASPAGGQVTGFRAGHMIEDVFTGALLIDDPVKPDDAHHHNIIQGINDSYNETVASRLAIETVPVIVVGQRIAHNDLSGYLLRGGSGEIWHHLCLPVIINNSEKYPDEYTHGRPIAHNLEDGWLWTAKHGDANETALKSHRRKYRAQYKQHPIGHGEDNSLWTAELIGLARSKEFDLHLIPVRTIVAIDPATSDTESSDEHGIVVASEYPDSSYSVDGDYSTHGSPSTWAGKAISAYKLHDADAIVIETNQGGDMCESTLRNAGFGGRIIRVHAKKGKVVRAEPIVALYELGSVQHRGGLLELEDELLDFDPETQKSNGASPNRLDACCYALIELAGITAGFADLLKRSIGSQQT